MLPIKNIETDFMQISFLDDKTVLIEVKDGVEINLDKAIYSNKLISEEMKSVYGMIINRKADYSIVPHEAYKILNQQERLRAIAIVVKKKNFLPLATEKHFYNHDLEAFESIPEAHQWLHEILNDETLED